VAGDPHRSLDVPNVYYQNHIACDEFDAVGLSFPGVPGFPHFGHNRSVAWCVTHTHADYQDLFMERFDTRGRYEFRGQWRTPETTRETIHVRGGGPVEIAVTVTHHGPLLLGDPTSATALALRYTATAEPNATFDALLPMLRATSADEMVAAIRPWVDPVNNFVFADVHGAIGYRTRGQVPIRAKANAWVPVRGWDGTHEWRGMIPFDEMPEIRNPSTGWIVTANSKVTGPDYPHYLGLDYAPDFRTRRIVEQVRDITGATVADMTRIHGDRVSLPARAFVELLSKIDVTDATAQRALDALRGWDGRMERDGVAPAIYSVFRECLMRDLMAAVLGPLHGEAFAGSPRGAVTHMVRLRARLPDMIRTDDRTLRPDGDWPPALRAALERAVRELTERFGPDMSSWRWGRLHATQPQHTLSGSFPELARLLDPPSQPMGGDGDTVQAASYIAGSGYGVTSTSVARYVFDLGDWERSAWVVPLGASGHPGSPHYADQASAWADVRLLPMRYDWTRIRAEAESHQTLEPAS
jgi:penicillin amidase